MNSQLRRIIIKSILVILNFVYTKKYLKDVIAGFTEKPSETNQEVLSRIKGISHGSCVLEEVNNLKVFRDNLFSVLNEFKNEQGGLPQKEKDDVQTDLNNRFTTYPDFRDLTEEVIFLYCSFSMSTNFSVDHLCSYVLPIGQNILKHCIYALGKSQEPNQDSASITSICSFSSVNALLESLIVLLRDQDKNTLILSDFEVSLLLIDIIKIIRLFESKSVADAAIKEQFDLKIKGMSQNIEMIVKLMFFAPIKLQKGSINLIFSMLDYHRYRKTGIFAVYCVALMI